MLNAASLSNSWEREVNRLQAVTNLQACYREAHPDASDIVHQATAEKLEEKIFKKANTVDEYRYLVSQGSKAIKFLSEKSKGKEKPSAEGGRSSEACPARNSTQEGYCSNRDPVFTEEAVSRQMKNPREKERGPSGRETDNGPILQREIPGRKSDDLKDAETDNKERKLGIPDIPTSTVTELVPFILQASTQVIGKVGTIEQLEKITESQKYSIAFLALERMSRGPQPFTESEANKQGTQSTHNRRIELVHEGRQLTLTGQVHMLQRVKKLRQKYEKDMETIHEKLKEDCESAYYRERMIANIGAGIKKLQESDNNGLRATDGTVRSLDHVEGIFRAAIERYGFFLRDRKSPDSSSSSSTSPTSGKKLLNAAVDQSGNTREPKSERIMIQSYQNKDKATRNTSLPEEDEKTDASFEAFHSQEYDQVGLPLLTITGLKMIYEDEIRALIPVVEAEIGDRKDMREDAELLAYVEAIFNLNTNGNRVIPRSVEKTIQQFCDRFAYLLGTDRTLNIEKSPTQTVEQESEAAESSSSNREEVPQETVRISTNVPPVIAPQSSDSEDDYDDENESEDEYTDDTDDDTDGSETRVSDNSYTGIKEEPIMAPTADSTEDDSDFNENEAYSEAEDGESDREDIEVKHTLGELDTKEEFDLEDPEVKHQPLEPFDIKQEPRLEALRTTDDPRYEVPKQEPVDDGEVSQLVDLPESDNMTSRGARRRSQRKASRTSASSTRSTDLAAMPSQLPSPRPQPSTTPNRSTTTPRKPITTPRRSTRTPRKSTATPGKPTTTPRRSTATRRTPGTPPAPTTRVTRSMTTPGRQASQPPNATTTPRETPDPVRRTRAATPGRVLRTHKNPKKN